MNPWGIMFQQGLFNMTSASEHFYTEARLLDEGWTRDGTDWVREADAAFERRVPLYEAKMIHHFDHRWATYAGGAADDEEGARDCTLAEKQNPAFEPSPRYWVPEDEVNLRAARLPSTLKRAYRENDSARCLKALAEALVGYYSLVEGRPAREEDLTRVLGCDHAWRTILGGAPERFLREPKTLANGLEMQREAPLTAEDLVFIQGGPGESISLVAALIDRKHPRWLMGWRRNTNATNERTHIASFFPFSGAGDSIFLWSSTATPTLTCVHFASLCSMVFDYIARQKMAGLNFSFYLLEQIATLPPSKFDPADSAYVVPRMLELTFTSHAMRPWAEDLGYSGLPFPWDEDRRAQLRAELDAFFARKYGLTRDELRYVLDPADVKGADYPSETFRVLKNREEQQFGEYRTQRLVLEAFDRLAGG
jgi:hypothetical protein